MHHPVLLKETVDGLNIKKDGLYIDATVGEGGDLIEIAKRGGKVLGIDADLERIKRLNVILGTSEARTPESLLDSGRAPPTKSGSLARMTNNITLVQGNFADIEKIARENNFFPVDGILFDLGLSMEQIEKSGRGFSYRNLDELLDMRIDRTLDTTASNLVNSLEQNELYEIFAHYGEEINSLAISKALVRARTVRPIEKVDNLIKVIDQVLGEKNKKVYARVFQALRIAVNNEFENLKKGLEGSLKILKNQGRIVVISFHSLEDRLVKRFSKENRLQQLNKKVIISKSGLAYERSAKMRIIQA